MYNFLSSHMQMRPRSSSTSPICRRSLGIFTTTTGDCEGLGTGFVAGCSSISGLTWRSCRTWSRLISSRRCSSTPRCCHPVVAAPAGPFRGGCRAVRSTGPAALSSHVSRRVRYLGSLRTGIHGSALSISNTPTPSTLHSSI